MDIDEAPKLPSPERVPEPEKVSEENDNIFPTAEVSQFSEIIDILLNILSWQNPKYCIDFNSQDQVERNVEEEQTQQSQPLNMESEVPFIMLEPLRPGSSSKVLTMIN